MQAPEHRGIASGVETPKLSGKALLTGASGFIGGRLRDLLLDQGVDVVAIRRRGSPPSKKGRSIEANYDDLGALRALVAEEKPDYVFHVAGVTKGVTYQDFQAGNVLPTKNLLRAIADEHPGLRRFVHYSSLACFGPSTASHPLSEGAPRKPIEHYGKSKLEAEEVVESFGNLPWTILRPGGVYGPGDVDYFNLFREVAKGRNVFFGNKDRWFSAVYVDDLLAASLLVADKEAAIRKAYFVCDQKPITWGEFQKAIVDAAGRPVLTMNLPEMLVSGAAFFGELATKMDKKPRLFNRQKAIMGAQEAWTCTSAALSADTGYAPQVGYKQGVERALAWYRKEKWL